MKETDKINLDLQDFKEGDVITNFIPIPVSLFSSSLSSTTMLIYACILNRAELSEKNGWRNKNGTVYVCYTIGKLAEYVGKGTTTVKTSLKELEDKGFIKRQREGRNRSIIYVRVPSASVMGWKTGSSVVGKPPSVGRKTDFSVDGKPSSVGCKSDFSVVGKPAPSYYIEQQDLTTKDRYCYEEGESL